jgi:ketosteroid isomerase-like protein
MRTLVLGGAIVALVLALSACGGSSRSSGSDQVQHDADVYAITQIEEKVHESLSKKDIGMMMGVWAEDATFTYGPGKTATGIEQIRDTWLKTKAFKPETQWVSDHPAWKLHVTVNGDRGTLHFECHFIDVKSGKVAATTAADMDVARIDGRWMITRMLGGTAELRP